MNIESESMKQRQNEAYATGRDNFDYNKRFKVLELEEERVQKQHDKILLDYALKREREANKSSKDKKEKLRTSAEQYAKYLKEKALMDASELSIIESAYKRDEECVLKTRDDTLHVRQVAKDALMRMVDEGRQEQLRSKKNQLLCDITDGQNYSMKYLANAREGVEKERADALRRRGLNVENRDKLQDQISIRKLKSERDRQDAYLLDKRMKYMERTEQQRLAEQNTSVRTYFPLKSSSINS